MSEQKTSPFLTALLSLFPISLLLLIDIYCMLLQPYAKALSHLAFAVLVAQLLCSLVFIKGDICNGQRSRLSQVQSYFGVFWVLWFLLSLFSNYHYILTDMICLCGIVMVLAARKQPQAPGIRRSVLLMGVFAGVIGMIFYLLMLINIPILGWIQYNVVAQTLLGIVLANLVLVISRNRLQGFIGLLPLVTVVLLLLNAIVVLILLAVSPESAVNFSNDFAFILYFVLHLVMAFILAIHIFRKTKLNYQSLMILLTMAATLPLWSTFAYI